MNQTLINSILVFIAGSSYGFIVPIVKVAGLSGIHPSQFIPLQYLIAFIVCALFVLIKRIGLHSPKQLTMLMLLGVFTGCTSLCYYTSVSLLPASAALTLLFQYIWVSVLIESIHKRKLPTRSTVIAVVIVLLGTLFATGLLDGSFASLDPIGVAFGAGSAIFYALFLYCSGTMATTQPTAVRTLMLSFGGLAITSIISPDTYSISFWNPEIWPYALIFSIIGILLPTSLINFASPKLSTGMVSIMASSELPIGILAAWAIVSDSPTPLVLFGTFLVLAGIIVKQVAGQRSIKRSSQ